MGHRKYSYSLNYSLSPNGSELLSAFCGLCVCTACFPPSLLTHLPTFRSFDVWNSQTYLCVACYPLLNYSCSICCNLQDRFQEVLITPPFLWHRSACNFKREIFVENSLEASCNLRVLVMLCHRCRSESSPYKLFSFQFSLRAIFYLLFVCLFTCLFVFTQLKFITLLH